MSCYRCAAAGTILLALLAAGCGQKSAAAAKAPAASSVPNVPKEDQLNTFEITAAAEVRLGIVTTPIEKRPIQRKRMYGGEVVLPTGASLIVTAPLTGFLRSPANGGLPKMGERVRKGQPLYELVQSILTPADKLAALQARLTLEQAQIDAEGQVQQTLTLVDAAQIELERSERLKIKDAGTGRQVDQAKAALALAEKQHEAAQARKKSVDNMHLDEEGMRDPLVVEAPQDGIVRAEHATAGEGVAAGAPLFEVMNTSVMWVKVPVYVGEEHEIAKAQPALLSNLEDRLGAHAITAPPVGAPTALALSSTADLYYEVQNPDGHFRPGQKVNANLALDDERESLVIAYSAVETDINGGTWVYENVGEHKFTRRRVQIKYVADDLAVLESGPPVGAKIVTEGAAELFGTEFGFAK